jgi:multicomponent Na+:H+ antiporter subunit E
LGGALFRAISLGLFLFVVWMLLSGHDETMLIVLGIVSCAVIVLLAHRMDLIDHEGHPVHLGWRAPLYWLWLGWQVVLANLHVARRVLGLGPAISPMLFRVKTSQKSELGKVIYANSITLTPGTISLRVTEDEIEIHALTRESADGLADGVMDRRVSQMEGSGR